MTFITNILTNAPIWIWPLLVLLVLIGLRASRDRAAPIWLLCILPFLGLLSLNAVNGLSPIANVWLVFAVSYGIGAGLGYRFQRGIIISKTSSHVHLRGEWLTLLVLMVIFWMNFVGGFLNAVFPSVYASTVFHMMFAAIAGLAAGSFMGRAAAALKAPVTAAQPA